MKLKDISNLGDLHKQAQEKKFQNENIKKLLAWQIANEVIIQPSLQPTIDAIKAGIVFVKATSEQVNALKISLNRIENETKNL